MAWVGPWTELDPRSARGRDEIGKCGGARERVFHDTRLFFPSKQSKMRPNLATPTTPQTGPPHLARKLYTLVVVHQAPGPSDAGPGDQAPQPAATPTSSPPPPRRRRVLLGRKLRGFGTGFFNGYGGKVEMGEGVAAAAARELTEEAGIVATDLHRRGTLTFWWADQPADPAWEVHVFGCTAFTGTPVETDEMAPAWFDAEVAPDGDQPVSGLPYDRMWADDPLWYRLMLDLSEQQAAASDGDGKAGLSARAADGSVGPLFMGAFEFRNVTELVGGSVERVEVLPDLPR